MPAINKNLPNECCLQLVIDTVNDNGEITRHTNELIEMDRIIEEIQNAIPTMSAATSSDGKTRMIGVAIVPKKHYGSPKHYDDERFHQRY